MTKAELVTKTSRAFGKAKFQLKNHSPEILVVAGVVGVITSAVLACRATTKLNTVLEKSKAEVEKIHEEANDPVNAEEFTKKDEAKALTVVYAQTGLQLAKLYAPAVVLGALSITSILASNNILRKRNLALAAAYATVDKGFKEYRDRVVERFGKNVDRELRYNLKPTEIEETVIDEKTGKEKKVKKTIDLIGFDEPSGYAVFFDEHSRYWEKDANYNRMFVLSRQQWANDTLRANGHLFLNEVLEALGLDKTPEGQIVGWVYDTSSDPIGDNYVDFGIFECNRPATKDFMNGYERSVLLDFNVDGNIWKLMKDKRYANNFVS